MAVLINPSKRVLNPPQLSFARLVLYWHTLRHLRARQIVYQIYYRLLKWSNQYHQRKLESEVPSTERLTYTLAHEKEPGYLHPSTFKFTNLSHHFDAEIDWNFKDYGKLWTYHLNYFDFLFQKNTDDSSLRSLISAFIAAYDNLEDGREPYPTSLRLINMIKYVSCRNEVSHDINRLIFTDAKWLLSRLEYHLMGNHLLENAFALLFAAHFFRQSSWFHKAEQLLLWQLEEQVLEDGAHFELSPMYHMQVTMRVMEAIDLLRHNRIFHDKHLLAKLELLAPKMLGWLAEMSYRNLSLPRFGDTIDHAFPQLTDVWKAAETLALTREKIRLSESGYRKFLGFKYELILDAGQISSDYIPGHGHADALHFVLSVEGQPTIVDTGCSTYSKNARRNWERSTQAHNTVVVDQASQSQIWSAFRVGQRASTQILVERKDQLEAVHDGYKNFHVSHNRVFKMDDHGITIEDELHREVEAEAFLHFHPKSHVELRGNTLQVDNTEIRIIGASALKLGSYEYCSGFHKTEPAQVLVCSFSRNLKTLISIH